MPFTAAHPALIVPLRRLGLPVSALAIGSMAPDFSRYLPFRVDETHSTSGLFTIDLAVAIAAYLLWHAVLAPAALAAAPRPVLARCAAFPVGVRVRLGSARAGAGVVAALLVGALTHVAWDSFTHAGRRGARIFPQVDRVVIGGQAGYWWIQVACSALGMLAVAWVLVRWWRRAPVTPVPVARRPAGALVAWAAVAVAAGWGAALGVEANTAAGGSLGGLPDYVLPRAVALAAVTGAALALMWRLGRLRVGSSGRELSR